jgi:predicted ATPase
LDWLTNGPRDLPKRQQTLKNTIEWGYDLLDETLQKLFMRLGVFKGKFDLEAVESIVNYDHTISGNMWENMMTLINKSILKMEPCLENDIDKYFDMLETIREYAVELLSGSEDEKSVKEKHSDFYLNLVVKADGFINGRTEVMAKRLEYARPICFSLVFMQSIIILKMNYMTEYWVSFGMPGIMD